ncbi:YppE family protein [Bacillus sp. CGMCC 1.16607]|uniref:YppE family protein n=1 Tax=Bacillus sp. CGMCC 1.16607 TaxID=3351842 RepID=UPI00364298CE
MEKQLFITTNKLLNLIEKGKEHFEKAKTSGKEGDFFTEVKPFSDIVKITADEWLDVAIRWIQIRNPKYINQKQLETTYDHLEKISIQSFYPNTSRKIFLSSIQSSQFVLQSIIQFLEDTPS